MLPMFRFLAFLLALLPMAAIAQGLPDLSEAGFEPCLPDELEVGEDVLVGGVDESGNFYFLSQKSSRLTSGKKLAGVAASDVADAVPDEIRWRMQASESSAFYLLTPDGQKGIAGGRKSATDLELTVSSDATVWILNLLGDKAVSLRSESEASRYLSISGYGQDGAYFGHFAESGADDIRLYLYHPVGDEASEPTSRLEDGVLTLGGTWAAEALASISWDDACALDLRGIRIPRDAMPFSRRPANCNLPVYVAERDRNRIPETWDFVVCGTDLCFPITLVDEAPLRLPFPVSVQSAPMSYERTFRDDGAWETLVLPFDASLPDGFEAYRLKDCSGDVLLFTSVERITAQEPVIIRPSAGHAGGSLLHIVSSGGDLSAGEAAGEPFCGTFSGFTLDAEHSDVYMLNPEGNAFVLASSGSKLKPFRACLHLSGRTSSMPLALPTGIAVPTSKGAESPALRYNLAGQRTGASRTVISIEGGRKLLQRREQ